MYAEQLSHAQISPVSSATLASKVATLHKRLERQSAEEKSAMHMSVLNCAKASLGASLLLAPSVLHNTGWILGVFIFLLFGLTASRVHAQPTSLLLTYIPAQLCLLAGQFLSAFWCIRTAFHAILEGFEQIGVPFPPGLLVVFLIITLGCLVVLNTNFHQFYKTSFFGFVLLLITLLLLAIENGVPLCIAVAALSFQIAPVMPLLEQSLKVRQQLPLVAALASAVLCATPLLAAYLLSGAPSSLLSSEYDFARGSARAHTTNDDGKLPAAALILFGFSLLTTYPLAMSPCHCVLEQWLFPQKKLVSKEDAIDDANGEEAEIDATVGQCMQYLHGIRDFLTSALRLALLLLTLFAALYTDTLTLRFVLAAGALALVINFIIPSVYRCVQTENLLNKTLHALSASVSAAAVAVLVYSYFKQ